MSQRSEFRVPNPYPYNRSSAWRWSLSHIGRYPLFFGLAFTGFITAWLVYSQAQVLIGRAINTIVSGGVQADLIPLTLTILALLTADGVSIWIGYMCAESIAARFEADARQELYESLLSKSKTFHDRQRVGDVMARATDDTNQLSSMIVPGGSLIFEAVMGFLVPLAFIFSVAPLLGIVPLIYMLVFVIIARRYLAELTPVIDGQRAAYGALNARLEETVSGIEVVKASSREAFERGRFSLAARNYRDLFVKQGRIEARYLPLLFYGFALGGTFLHAIYLYQIGTVNLGQIISVMGLVNVLRFPTFISVFAFSTFKAGTAGARRILGLMADDGDLDENQAGHSAPIAGAISFEQVRFGYNDAPDGGMSYVLNDINLQIAAGQTVAIVGQTGSGKSALTALVNRSYDASDGRVLIDGVDVRDWSLDALRAQVGKIEQDIFLFSRSIADNIAFGRPAASRAEVEAAARSAQADAFISALPDGYDTVVGERGMTLSGGQRQRIALARAFLSDPRILILDDSTSAIDSATEDEIQRAIQAMQRGRTTLLITSRLSQIRWADQIIVLDQGRIAAAGTHTELLTSSPHYQRIFARYAPAQAA